MSSLEKNPEVRGSPAIASVAAVYAKNVRGMCLRRPPMLRMSCEPSVSWMRVCIAWITEPAARKSAALKNAWVTTWKMPEANAPTPTPTNMYPSWLTVE